VTGILKRKRVIDPRGRRPAAKRAGFSRSGSGRAGDLGASSQGVGAQVRTTTARGELLLSCVGILAGLLAWARILVIEFVSSIAVSIVAFVVYRRLNIGRRRILRRGLDLRREKTARRRLMRWRGVIEVVF
jgi:hypothetical protein